MSSTRKLMDTPASTRTYFGASNSTRTTPNNVKLSTPNDFTSTTATQNGDLGRKIGNYFQTRNQSAQTPASTGLKKEYPTSNGVSSRGGGGGPYAAAAQAVGDTANGAIGGIQGSWQIGQNAIVTNNWFNNVSGVNGIYSGMHERASMQASAEQRGIDRSNNLATMGKATGGPLGYLVGFGLGKMLRNTYVRDEMNKTNFKNMPTTDQKLIDPKDAAISTSRPQKTVEDVQTKNKSDASEGVANRNLAYGYGGKPSGPTLDEKDSLTEGLNSKTNSEIQPGAMNHDLIDQQEVQQQKVMNEPNLIQL